MIGPGYGLSPVRNPVNASTNHDMYHERVPAGLPKDNHTGIKLDANQ